MANDAGDLVVEAIGQLASAPEVAAGWDVPDEYDNTARDAQTAADRAIRCANAATSGPRVWLVLPGILVVAVLIDLWRFKGKR